MDVEVPMPVHYEGLVVDTGFRIDMMIDNCIVIENKVVQKILPVHEAQLITYLKLSGIRLGLLVNWHVRLIKHGIKRIVNGL